MSSLDRFRLVSNSDAHSPEKLGREACVFDTEFDYFSIRRALEAGQGYQGTVEFLPEEGKYHLDGHRNCNVRLSPHETKKLDGRCPECGSPLTVGVMRRIDDLADRDDETQPETEWAVQSLVPLPEILSEILHVGPKNKKVGRHYEGLLDQLGPELQLINEVPLEDIQKTGDSVIAEAISRLRRQEVIREAGYNGVYGTIKLFREDELSKQTSGASLFKEERNPQAKPNNAQNSLSSESGRKKRTPAHRKEKIPSNTAPATTERADSELSLNSLDILAGLDNDQRKAAEMIAGPLLIVAALVLVKPVR